MSATKCRCKGKRSHHSLESAIAAAVRLSRNNVPLRPYRCPTASGVWHLTHHIPPTVPAPKGARAGDERFHRFLRSLTTDAANQEPSCPS